MISYWNSKKGKSDWVYKNKFLIIIVFILFIYIKLIKKSKNISIKYNKTNFVNSNEN